MVPLLRIDITVVSQTLTLMNLVQLQNPQPAAMVKWISHEATNLLLPVRVGLAAPVETGISVARKVVILEG